MFEPDWNTGLAVLLPLELYQSLIGVIEEVNRTVTLSDCCRLRTNESELIDLALRLLLTEKGPADIRRLLEDQRAVHLVETRDKSDAMGASTAPGRDGEPLVGTPS
jgi:hypothetical protein